MFDFRLNKNQLKQLAEFTSNLSLVFFATAAAPIFSQVERINVYMVLSGIALSIGCLLMSLIILEVKNDKS